MREKLVQWLRFIKEPENERVKAFMKENKYLEQAKKELEHLSGVPNFKRLLESRAGFLRDVDAKIYVSREEGEKKKQTEIAKKMKLKNKPIEEIIEFTGLSKEEIEQL